MQKSKFWPFDLDPEGEIYENVAWDLPGYRKRKNLRSVKNLAKSRRRRTFSGSA